MDEHGPQEHQSSVLSTMLLCLFALERGNAHNMRNEIRVYQESTGILCREEKTNRRHRMVTVRDLIERLDVSRFA